MALGDKTVSTLINRINGFINRHRVHGSIAIAIVATLLFTASQVVPSVQQFITQSNVLQYVTLLLVVDLAMSVFLHQVPSTTKLIKNQDESFPLLMEAIRCCRHENADLLEYAGSTTLPLIRAIRREGVPMRMLVKHPDTVDGLQRDRMITTLDTIYNSIFEDYGGQFEVRCYRQPYGLRGRRLGSEILEIGWLTHDFKRQMAFGHANPSLVADLSTKSNDYLRMFFDRTFDDLWKADDTEDGRSVLLRLGHVVKLAADKQVTT